MLLFRSDKKSDVIVTNRLIMGKKEMSFSASIGIFGFFTEIFIEISSTFHKALVQSAEFDWLPGR